MTVAKFFAVLLIIVGVLMVLFCGGCTLTVLGAAIYSSAQEGGPTAAAGITTSLIVVGIIGGLPTAAGAVMVWAGWRMVKAKPDDLGSR